MNDIKPLTIKPNLFHLFFQLLVGFALVFAAGVIVTRQGAVIGGATGQTVMIIGWAILAVGIAYFIVQLLSGLSHPSLIFDHQGITDNTAVFAWRGNYLPWENVSGMAVIHSTLILKVKNPPRQRRNALMKQMSREFDANYTIDVNLISTEDLEAIRTIAKQLDKKTGVWQHLGEDA
ncbi:hypothetical protein [Lacticaseibacillus camelliae]|uniref:Uncharacterized protein n=1 Tax=Lacticaseibacillus camelliae DSM 22697 = JCM 13995 TaxID=1423730 RepID=A0A0R2EZB1_9LACO|nr:hypothetical protein [Lacticaseibacillus camelliae]KRN21470.1 hypothetical protein FC75_GL002272 [Lacticaseibacillus camelliae DSM 22697 = JCM 13995]